MRARTVVTFLSAPLMLMSCKSEVRPDKSGAEFRSLAREMYSSMERPSCDKLQDFDRRDYLKAEASAVADLEAQAKTTPAWGHLAIAREDARYEVMHSEGCWSDPSRRWAVLHVKMTQDKVAKALPALKALIPLLGELPIEDAGDLKEMAEFRDLARRLLTTITPICPLTASASMSDEEVLLPASGAVARLKKEFGDTRFAAQFAIVEADVAHQTSITIAECAQPSTTEPKQVSLELAVRAEEQIAAIRKIVKG